MSRNVLATERLCNYNVINIDGFVKSLFCSMEFSKDFLEFVSIHSIRNAQSLIRVWLKP